MDAKTYNTQSPAVVVVSEWSDVQWVCVMHAAQWFIHVVVYSQCDRLHRAVVSRQWTRLYTASSLSLTHSRWVPGQPPIHTATHSSRNVRRHLLCLRNADDDSSMTCQYVTTQCTGKTHDLCHAETGWSRGVYTIETMQQMYHGKGKRGKFLQPFSGT